MSSAAPERSAEPGLPAEPEVPGRVTPAAAAAAVLQWMKNSGALQVLGPEEAGELAHSLNLRASRPDSPIAQILASARAMQPDAAAQATEPDEPSHPSR